MLSVYVSQCASQLKCKTEGKNNTLQVLYCGNMQIYIYFKTDVCIKLILLNCELIDLVNLP